MSLEAGGLYAPPLDSPSEDGLDDVGGRCVEFKHDAGDVCVGLEDVFAENGEPNV